MNKSIAVLLAFTLSLSITAGCQAPPATPGYQVNLTATAPAADGDSNPYDYAVFREQITGTTCDATTSTNWKEITTTATRPATPAYTDTGVAASGGTYCYFMVTYQLQSGSTTVLLNSSPSNVALVNVPGVPTAPALNTPTTSQQAEIVRPALPFLNPPTLAAACTVHSLAGRVTRRV